MRTTVQELVECLSKETAGHLLRVGRYARHLGRLAGMSRQESDDLLFASRLHDIGKAALPDLLLEKPGPLTSAEFQVVQTHCAIGYRMLSRSSAPLMKKAARIALEHHERWDGGGYPRGLRGAAIHLEGRILALVDVFDALRTERVYKRALPLEEVVEDLAGDDGGRFDPLLLEVMLSHVDDFEEIHSMSAVTDPAARMFMSGAGSRSRLRLAA